MMPHGVARHMPCQPRIIVDLDAALEDREPRALIEFRGALMIERAGVYPEARNRLGPGPFQRPIHQPAAGSAAQHGFVQPEKAELSLSRHAEIKLQQSNVAAIGPNGEE